MPTTATTPEAFYVPVNASTALQDALDFWAKEREFDEGWGDLTDREKLEILFRVSQDEIKTAAATRMREHENHYFEVQTLLHHINDLNVKLHKSKDFHEILASSIASR